MQRKQLASLGSVFMRKLTPYLLRAVGLVLILIGLVAAYYGPLEIFVFYFFSEGGRFHYDGFGMGSLWLAALVLQNLGYYVIAALCLPLGIGHVKLRRWALTLTQLTLCFWLGAGLLLLGEAIALLPSVLRLNLSRDIVLSRLLPLGAALLLSLGVLPALALVFYRSRAVKAVFETRDPHRYWTERVPFSVLALLLLLVILIGVLHLAIFLQGLFPVFGRLLLGRPSAYIISLCILVLGALIYGIARLEKWAWWGSLGFIALLAISTTMSFSRYSFLDIIVMLNPPTYELELLDKLAIFYDHSLVGLLAAPLVLTIGLIVHSRRYFWSSHDLDQSNAG